MSQDQRQSEQLQRELQQFTGDLDRFRHPLNPRVVYTPGMRHLAERAGAYWLIDAIASWIGSPPFRQAAADDERIGSLHFWKLSVQAENSTATLTAVVDTGEPAFITQRIRFTDFPLEVIEVWAGFDGRHWTLYLPSEH